MENQHRKITGCRELSQAEIDTMNEIKAKGEELRALVAKIGQLVQPPLQAIEPATAGDEAVIGELSSTPVEQEGDDPLYWLRHADSSFRCGVMYAIRAVAQPTSY